MERGLTQRLYHDYAARVRGFSANARLFLLVSILTGIGLGVQGVVFNLFLLDLGYNEAVMGELTAYGAITAVLFSLPAGWIADRVGRRATLVGAGFTAGVGLLLQILWPAPALLLAGTILGGAGGAAMLVTSAPILADASSPGERSHLFSVTSAFSTVAGIAGSLLGGWLPGWLGRAARQAPDSVIAYRSTLLFSVVVIALAVWPILRMREVRTPGAVDAKRLVTGVLGLTRPGLALKLLVPNVLIGAGAGLFVPFLNVFFARKLGASAEQIGVIMSLLSAVTAGSMLLSPLLARRIGVVRTVAYLQLASLPFLLLLAFAPTLPLAAAAAWIRAALMNAGDPLVGAFAMDVVPVRERAFVNSLLGMGWNLGWAGSAKVGGLLMTQSFTAPYVITFVCYLAASLSFFWFFRKDNRFT